MVYAARAGCGGVDPDTDDVISDCFDALASPVRLRLLRRLRQPSPLAAIEVAGERAEAGATLARQTVRRHLDRLIEAGIVSVRHEKGADEYVTNHQRLFVLSEGLRDFARLRPAVEPDEVTVPANPRALEGGGRHRLVLVRGLDEGTTFDLARGGSAWRIGRRRGLEVSLDYDPAVSSENALVRWEDGRHVLEDVVGSRNGTLHNFRRLQAGERVPLRHGDLVGVGRSLLLYWTS